MAKEKKEKHKKEKDHKRRREDDDEERAKERAQKLAKKVTRHLQKSAAATGHGYTNAENPFGDANVTQRFVWGKKIEKQLQEGADVRDLTAKAEKERQLERLREIEKVKQRREQRAAERAQQEEELSLIARQRAEAEGFEAEAKEEEFHLENAKKRAQQRLREGRAKPIDVLAANLFLMEEFDADLAAPYSVFVGLSLAECEQLRDDIKGFQALDAAGEEHRDFWAALATVADAELKEAQRQDAADRACLRGEPTPEQEPDQGMTTAVDTDIHLLLAGKTHRELVDMEEGIARQLEAGDAADPEFLAAVLRRLALAKARARLREIHAGLLERHLARLRAAPDTSVDVAAAMGWDREDEAAPSEPALAPAGAGDAATAGDGAEGMLPPAPRAPAGEPDQDDDEEEDEQQEENVGQWSPRALEPEHVPLGQDIIPEEEDARLLELLRAQVKYRAAKEYSEAALQAASRTGGISAADRAYQDMLTDGSRAAGGVHPMMRLIADAAPQQGEVAMRSGLPQEVVDEQTRGFQAASQRLMGDMKEAGDAPFRGEVQLDSKVYWWHEKYRPRKAKYFNRVHTGYEWNKYNQTHYDHDNPPPKVVQGYKFNIFFPDLIDKQEAPVYFLDKDPDADEHGSTCLLRFHAGPPYEDIAFKILNKEWEYSHKKGFKCTFERGILHLYFNFRRQRYRR